MVKEGNAYFGGAKKVNVIVLVTRWPAKVKSGKKDKREIETV